MTESNPSHTPEAVYGPQESACQHREPSGLRGWLLLIAIALIISPFRQGAFLLHTYVPVFQDGTWEALTTPGSEHRNMAFAAVIIFEIVGGLGFIVANVALGFLFFRKSRLFPRAYITYLLASVCYAFLDTLLALMVMSKEAIQQANVSTEVMQIVVPAAVWVPYMMVSRRVKNTFVE